jgi:hypothetical protein
MSYGLLNALPIPNSDRAREVAALAGRLSFVDERYSDFADRVGLTPQPLQESERLSLEAQIDAHVARAYGLDEKGLRLIFDDFVEASLPQSYRELVLSLFEGQV